MWTWVLVAALGGLFLGGSVGCLIGFLLASMRDDARLDTTRAEWDHGDQDWPRPKPVA